MFFGLRMAAHTFQPFIVHVLKDVATASHDFLLQRALFTLQAPCFGPYRIIHRVEKTYCFEVHGAVTTVSNDRLKSADVLHVNTESASPAAIPVSHDTLQKACTLHSTYGASDSQMNKCKTPRDIQSYECV
jgi:hypothetical protein